MGLSAIAPEVLNAEEPKFDHAWEGQFIEPARGPTVLNSLGKAITISGSTTELDYGASQAFERVK